MVSSGPSPLPSNLPLGRTLAAAVGAMVIVLAACVVQVLRADRACGRDFTYACDDAYVHLALARQMADPPADAQPGSAAARAMSETTSPIWTALLAGIARLAPPKTAADGSSVPNWVPRLAPLILNLAIAGLLVLLLGHALRLDVLSSAGMFVRLLLVAVFMPIPLLVLTGMEHLAHAFVLMLAVASGVEVIERERLAARRVLFSMVWMALAVGLRYESLAVLLALVLWAWIRRRLRRVVALGFAGLGVAVGIAAYVATHGQPWLPEPLRARLLGGAVDGSAWGRLFVDRAVTNLQQALVPAALIAIAAAMLWSRREQQSSPDAEDRIRVGWLFVVLVAGAIHVLAGRMDEPFRHTAYLVPLGVVAIVRALANRPGAKWAPSAPVGLRHAVMAVFCLLPLSVAAVPAVKAAWYAPEAGRRVYAINRLMASFVRTYFPESVVASNEPGVLRYETQALTLNLGDTWSTRRQDESLDRAEVALMVSGPGRAGTVSLPGWQRVGGWRVTGPQAIGAAYVDQVAVWSRPARAGDARSAVEVFTDRQLAAGAVRVPLAAATEPADGGSASQPEP